MHGGAGIIMDKEPKFKIDAGKAADTAAGTVVGAIGLAAKIVVTVLLVLLTTVLLLGCVFAFYVKTCLTEDLNVSLSDYQLSESSIIFARRRRANTRSSQRSTVPKTGSG